MKFFAASLFVLLLVGGSFGSPSPNHQGGLGLNLGGILSGVGGTVDGLLDGLLGTLGNTVEGLSVPVRNILEGLPKVTSGVVRTVDQLLSETGKSLICTVKEVVNGVLHFTVEVADGIIDISINPDTMEVCIGDNIIGRVLEDGSICDNEGNVIGLLDAVNRVVVVAGKTVDELLANVVSSVDKLLGGILKSADELLGGGVSEAVRNALRNLSVEVRRILDQLPVLTSEVVNALDKLVSDTHKVLVCTFKDLVNNIFTFTGEASGENMIVSLDLTTNEITIDGVPFGTYNNKNGKIFDNEGNFVGALDPETGCIVFAGDNAPSTTPNQS